MSGFTPGPWRYDGHEVWGTRPVRFNLTTACTPMIAEVCKHSDTDGGFPFEANARLIASAPEMLDLIKQAASHLEAGINEYHGAPDDPPQPASEWDYLAGQLVSELRALIAKATGESA